MGSATADKVTADHLRRAGYLYVRQSTLRQVAENTTSTERQYALRQRAVALGWPAESVIVVDEDLGRSGASAEGRDGFQRLVADVGMGRAGIVLGLEVSRLARNNADWHRLLEICALTETLICDEDGLYDPCDFNDRLVLGLKGTMSEAELHLLKARLRGGQLARARSDELPMPLPVGFVYDPAGRVVLDPDQGVQGAVRHLFATFERAGSARATVKAFADEGVLFPLRVQRGPNKGALGWHPLHHHRVLQVLHNPRYAGAFVYGRRRQRRGPDGRTHYALQPRENWISLIPGAHEGYISWEQFEANQRQLAACAQARGDDRRKSPPREGPALLQGLAICGRCGKRMTVRYNYRGDTLIPVYGCARIGIETATPFCQSILGAGVDLGVSELLLETITPMALEVALAVSQELDTRADEADRLRRTQVERARHTAEVARRRYLSVDPDNRLVAASLEADWNDSLRALTAAQEDYERQRADASPLSAEQRKKIAALATDFPALWNDPRTPQRERKRMVRLLLEDVTLLKSDSIAVHVRFKGGQTTSLNVPLTLAAPLARKTPDPVVAEIDRLLDHHTDTEVAEILNNNGVVSGSQQAFNKGIIVHIRNKHGLRSRQARLRDAGMVSLGELAEALGIHTSTIKQWALEGRLESTIFNDKGERMYAVPTRPPFKQTGRPPKHNPRGRARVAAGKVPSKRA